MQRVIGLFYCNRHYFFVTLGGKNIKAKATDFRCPHCKNLLNVSDNIVFSTRNRWGKEGIVLLHPELGNYSVIMHPGFVVSKGELLDFYCPYF